MSDHEIVLVASNAGTYNPSRYHLRDPDNPDEPTCNVTIVEEGWQPKRRSDIPNHDRCQRCSREFEQSSPDRSLNNALRNADSFDELSKTIGD